ncbi:MAG: efflux RND transporter periplasmic adaptor subunit [Pseudomonadota bacterium]
MASETMEEVLSDTATEHAVKHLDPKYVCPMHPQIVRDEPGSCPICGMDLVARQIEPMAGKKPVVAIRGEMVQSMGVRTQRVKRDTLWRYIRTVGRLDFDETRLVHMHPRAPGWMETLEVRAEGEPVKAGDLLGTFYSPEILSAEVDFLIALEGPSAGLKRQVEKARNRLRLLGISDGTIAEIQKAGKSRNSLPLYAPGSGIVTMIGAREGMYVAPADEILTIADLSSVWVIVDIFEHQIDWLREGLKAEITVPAYPGHKWEGGVDYLYPELDAKARTLRVRLVFDNPDLKLKPNMFADVVIYGGAKRDVLAVPREALIVTGERESVVVALGEGRFQPVDVVSGIRTSDKMEILSGLKEGDEVVVSGQFLIDSESSLQASFLRMSDSDAPDSAPAAGPED